MRYHACERYVVHRSYDIDADGTIDPFDIALVKLEDKVNIHHRLNFVYPKACRFGPNWQKMYKYGTVIGLGLVNQSPEIRATQLMEAVLQIDENCGLYNLRRESSIQQTQCCYTIPGRAATCTGDAGGPIMFMQHGQVKCLIGISSFNAKCCLHPYYPSVFTGMRVFRTWIIKHVNELT